MALFSRKKNTEKPDTPVQKESKKAVSSVGRNLTSVLKHARITEKATVAQASNVYAFDVDTSASKRDIMQAVNSLYGVEARKVAVVNIRRKAIRNARTGRVGVKGGGRKAYVYLKKGDSITVA
jgi:large subunit ribosomal protein L23